jgi:feruloyl esterase
MVLALHFGAVSLLASGLALASDCDALKEHAPPDGEITDATLWPAGPLEVPPELGPARTMALPSSCRVQGVLRPAPDSDIRFEVWLPADGWNGRFQGIGNGGSAGSIGYSGLHPEKIVDFGWSSGANRHTKAF